MNLIPHQCVYSIPFSESLHQFGLVLPDTLKEVGGYAYVQGAFSPTGEEIHTWLTPWVPAFAGTTIMMQRAGLLTRV
jgi:hypothetical protein